MMDLTALSDCELTARLNLYVVDERRCLAEVLEHLAEFDKRKLAVKRGFSSLFQYATHILGYSEEAAYGRIAAARAAVVFPGLITRLREGRLTLTAAMRLAPHLTSDNHRSLLDWARGKTRREIDIRIAALAPQPERGEEIRHLPSPQEGEGETIDLCLGVLAQEAVESAPPESGAAAAGGGTNASAGAPGNPAPPPEPLDRAQAVAPGRVRFAFTGDESLLMMVERAKAILRHKHPYGRLEEVLAEVLAFYLARRDPALKAGPAAPRAATGRRRRIPQWVRDAVFKRDGGACAYVGEGGRRCGETGFLEYDHVLPWAQGGLSDHPGNVRLLCRAHNQEEARRAGAARVQ